MAYVEIDSPGHTASIAWSQPDLISGYNEHPWPTFCNEPPCGQVKLNNDGVYDFFDKLDFFGMEGKSPPKWLRPHFDAFLTMLDDYEISPWSKGDAPSVHMVYAKDGVCSHLKPSDPRPEVRDDDPREMKWLLNTRSDFSAEGWKSLVGDRNVKAIPTPRHCH